MAKIEAANKEKRLVIEDHVAREEYAEQTRLMAGQFSVVRAALLQQVSVFRAYGQRVDTSSDSLQAVTNMKVFESYEQDYKVFCKTSVASCTDLGQGLIQRKYATALSKFEFSGADEVGTHLAGVANDVKAAGTSLSSKRAILADAVKLQEFKDESRLVIARHGEMFVQVKNTVADMARYFSEQPRITSVREADVEKSVYELWMRKRGDLESGLVNAIINVEVDITMSEYKSAYSSWNADRDFTPVEGQMQAMLQGLKPAIEKKLALIQDARTREGVKLKCQLGLQQHDRMNLRIADWIDGKISYLELEEACQSINDARVLGSRVAAVEAEKNSVVHAMQSAFLTAKEQLTASKHESVYSQWVFDKAADVESRHRAIDALWAKYNASLASKQRRVASLLASEIKKEESRLDFANAIQDYSRFYADTVSYIQNQLGNKSGNAIVILDLLRSHGAEQDQESHDVIEESTRKQANLQKAEASSISLGVKDNPYATLSTEDIRHKHADIAARFAERRRLFADLLKKSEENDVASEKVAGAVKRVQARLATSLAQLMRNEV